MSKTGRNTLDILTQNFPTEYPPKFLCLQEAVRKRFCLASGRRSPPAGTNAVLSSGRCPRPLCLYVSDKSVVPPCEWPRGSLGRQAGGTHRWPRWLRWGGSGLAPSGPPRWQGTPPQALVQSGWRMWHRWGAGQWPLLHCSGWGEGDAEKTKVTGTEKCSTVCELWFKNGDSSSPLHEDSSVWGQGWVSPGSGRRPPL